MSLATPSGNGAAPLFRESQRRFAALLIMLSLLLAWGAPNANAGPRTTNISITPIVKSLTIQNGYLQASGVATTVIKGKTYAAPFTTPVTITASPAAAGSCPILNLHLGPINLNLLGLVVQTSPICLSITANQGGGLLGDLLCSLANALNGGINLNAFLGALSPSDLTALLGGLTDIINGALGQLVNAVLTAINHVNSGHTCAILNLALGPLDLNLLGLNVHLDNCSNGPVTVDITAVTGQGNLLGNLLCQLLGGNAINLGATLQQILGLLQGLLTV